MRKPPPTGSIDLTGYRPKGERWDRAPREVRRRIFRLIADEGKRAKLAELGKGHGANGRRLPPRKRRRDDGADGPVLNPHRDASRTRRTLRSYSDARSARIYWTRPWVAVLIYHALGLVRGAPKRDVVSDLAPLSRKRVERAVARAWETTR